MPDPYVTLHPNVKLPPYVYQEYPKWVTDTDGKKVLARSREEEDRATGFSVEEEATKPPVNRLFNAAAPMGETVVEDLSEATKLQLQADKLGIDVDRRWGVKKLRSVIEAHS